MKIAIYSGSIPSTTFIENLIKGVASEHEVLLFGKQTAHVKYDSPNIKIYGTPKNKFANVIMTLFRVLKLMVLYPKRFVLLWKELKIYEGEYKRWNILSRLVPVILNKPDVFHIQWAKDIKQWVFLKDKFGVKLVLSLRGAHINYSPIADEELANTYKQLFPKVDRFHAVSQAIALEAQKYHADKDKIELIHSPIAKPTFDAFRVFEKNNSDGFHIVSVGRFHWKKGYKYAIDAVKLLKEQGVQIHYTIIASNVVSEAVLFQIHQLGLENEITIMKGLPQEILFKKMQSFDAVILPSLEEGIANVVLEAMALGVPVISTDCGGMAEVVIPNKTGWLVPVRNPEALVQAVIELSQTSESELQNITKQAHEFVKLHFNAEDSIKQFLELYREIVN
ncbi:glycosyltransferase family 4 protein [Seonamhaeicola aphaedonensis]|uniref:Colanic acid/amylovoran biosynthesis glycosyltransferase n=1 Tax=Seonamhaeicola aphaedonensis TaxID=1461338 RepID=A0A3D9HGH1_9FLAO|nr:glycosyltransferase family 4 protein [Seonamhaeicola aphaedonensis]RED48361.1 colanic acid/amylovoran biosynthesis glycosyltransferase [Seonamhaeicola aphaedonensis]